MIQVPQMDFLTYSNGIFTYKGRLGSNQLGFTGRTLVAILSGLARPEQSFALSYQHWVCNSINMEHALSYDPAVGVIWLMNEQIMVVDPLRERIIFATVLGSAPTIYGGSANCTYYEGRGVFIKSGLTSTLAIGAAYASINPSRTANGYAYTANKVEVLVGRYEI